jgi:uncharacterized protein (TIGR02145 family)
MDRNLGASQAATSSTDTLAYGDLYQWGRVADGHQCRNSANTTTLSTTDQPGHGMFIISYNDPMDWRTIQNENLWQGVNGINNPCPIGYKIPTSIDFENEINSWNLLNNNAGFYSNLKIPIAGYRNQIDGSLNNPGQFGFYWSNTNIENNSLFMYLNAGDTGLYSDFKAEGFSIRCIKEN